MTIHCLQEVVFSRSSHWCSPPVHPLLRRVVPGQSARPLVLQCNLQAAVLSYLHDHQVSPMLISVEPSFVLIFWILSSTRLRACSIILCAPKAIIFAGVWAGPNPRCRHAGSCAVIRAPTGTRLKPWQSVSSAPGCQHSSAPDAVCIQDSHDGMRALTVGQRSIGLSAQQSQIWPGICCAPSRPPSRSFR